jgi:hypothetical protein
MAARKTSTKPAAEKPAFRKVGAALQAVRAGDTTTTPMALLAFEEQGLGEASAALAMIAAYGRRWDEALKHAARAFARPGGIYAGNVWDDLEVLLLRAARETGSFAAALTAVPAKASWKNGTALYQGIRRRLSEHESGTFAADPPEPSDPAGFAEALASIDPREAARSSEPERARERFQLAVSCGVLDEALAVLSARPTALYYDHLLAVAPALIARGEGERAFSALTERLWSWSEVDAAQIAPADFLGDTLWPFATPERLARVLATPRGVDEWNAAYASGKAEL